MFVTLLFCFLLILVFQTDFDAINKRQFCILSVHTASSGWLMVLLLFVVASALFVIICSFICKLSQAFKQLQWLSLRILKTPPPSPPFSTRSPFDSFAVQTWISLLRFSYVFRLFELHWWLNEPNGRLACASLFATIIGNIVQICAHAYIHIQIDRYRWKFFGITVGTIPFPPFCLMIVDPRNTHCPRLQIRKVVFRIICAAIACSA